MVLTIDPSFLPPSPSPTPPPSLHSDLLLFPSSFPSPLLAPTQGTRPLITRGLRDEPRTALRSIHSSDFLPLPQSLHVVFGCQGRIWLHSHQHQERGSLRDPRKLFSGLAPHVFRGSTWFSCLGQRLLWTTDLDPRAPPVAGHVRTETWRPVTGSSAFLTRACRDGCEPRRVRGHSERLLNPPRTHSWQEVGAGRWGGRAKASSELFGWLQT